MMKTKYALQIRYGIYQAYRDIEILNLVYALKNLPELDEDQQPIMSDFGQTYLAKLRAPRKRLAKKAYCRTIDNEADRLRRIKNSLGHLYEQDSR